MQGKHMSQSPQSLEINNILKKCAILSPRGSYHQVLVHSQEEWQQLALCWGSPGLHQPPTPPGTGLFVNNLWFLGGELSPTQRNSS